jgi:hypothetical protein
MMNPSFASVGELPALPEGQRWWIAEIDIGRVSLGMGEDILAARFEGAITWHGVIAATEDDIEETIRRDLGAVGLRLMRLLEVEELIELSDIEDDLPDLAENIRDWNGRSATVWGLLHCYLAEGTA